MKSWIIVKGINQNISKKVKIYPQKVLGMLRENFVEKFIVWQNKERKAELREAAATHEIGEIVVMNNITKWKKH